MGFRLSDSVSEVHAARADRTAYCFSAGFAAGAGAGTGAGEVFEAPDFEASDFTSLLLRGADNFPLRP